MPKTLRRDEAGDLLSDLSIGGTHDGHHELVTTEPGDEILRSRLPGFDRRPAGATRLQQRVPADLVARMGGDEILVLLAYTHGRDEAVQIAEKIRKRVTTPMNTGGRSLTVTISIGVTILVEGDDPDGLIARADAAMYEAKRLGRDRVIAL